MSMLDTLAIFGGTPTFDQPLHVGAPQAGDHRVLLARFERVLSSGRLTNDGPCVQEFEARVAEHVGVKHCVAFCNGTVALSAAASICGLRGRVIVPAFTFIATAHALTWLGLTPVFCDVDPDTHNIDPAHAASLITDDTTAIVGVHVWGRPCAVDALERLAGDRGLVLMFDAAHAFGCGFRGAPIGGFGALEVFSFHATKIVSAVEGGAITTNDDRLAAAARLVRNFGFKDYDHVAALGTNGKLSELHAAVGLETLSHFDEVKAINRRNHHRYAERLRSVNGASLVAFDESNAPNYQYVAIEWDGATTGCSRDELHRMLWAENVFARRYFYPGCHRMAPYADAGDVPILPATDALSARTLCLPTGPSVDLDAIDAITGLIARAAEHGTELRARMATASPRA